MPHSPWQHQVDNAYRLDLHGLAPELGLDLYIWNIPMVNVTTEGLKWRPMLWQMQENMLRQTLHVHVTSDTQKIHSSYHF